MKSMVIHIVPIGKQIKHVYEGLNGYEGVPTKVHLLHSPNGKSASQKFEKIAKEVEKEIIRRWNCKVERTKIDFLDMKDVQEAILKIIHQELKNKKNDIILTDLAINVTGGTNVMAVGSILASALSRVPSYYVHNRDMDPDRENYVTVLQLPDYKEKSRLADVSYEILDGISSGEFYFPGVQKYMTVHRTGGTNKTLARNIFNPNWDHKWDKETKIQGLVTRSKLFEILDWDTRKKRTVLDYHVNDLENRGLIRRIQTTPEIISNPSKRPPTRTYRLMYKVMYEITDLGNHYLKYDFIQ